MAINQAKFRRTLEKVLGFNANELNSVLGARRSIMERIAGYTYHPWFD
jgi:hypothetical protein